MSAGRSEKDAAHLIGACRWGGLATIADDGLPLASQVAFAPEAATGALVLHLSRLAEHTRNLLVRPRASLVVGEPDDGRVDPQTLARLTVVGSVATLDHADPAYVAARAAYLARLPEAAPRFSFADFVLMRLAPDRGHYVGGFARARALDATAIATAVRHATAHG